MAKGICRDDEILAALKAAREARGRMPTEKELCHEIGVKRSQLHRNIKRLVVKGVLKRDPVGTLRVRINEGTRP